MRTATLAPAASASQTAPPARVERFVGIDPTPACEPRRGPGPGAPADAGIPRKHAWLENSTIQHRLGVLDRAIEPFRSEWIGTFFHDVPPEAVVVFHTDFQGYEALRRSLEQVASPLRVVLRPGCHSRARIEAARRVLEQRAWHPRAASTDSFWAIDASFSGFAVIIDEKAPEVARALEHELGPLVRVDLGSPGLQARPATSRR